MRAIDLYSGIGGWALGLKLADIELVGSYEYWEPAIRTHEQNLSSLVHQVNIRNLQKADLPQNIDIVVGSPPCTQFSYSNRGGNGDLIDGLRDIYKFFQIVDWLKPKYWAMENVPRVEKIILQETAEGGVLQEFSEIIEAGTFRVVDFSKYGIPQKRKRCICGNFDFAALDNYGSSLEQKSLGDVLKSLHQSKSDPVYKSSEEISFSDMENEEYFSDAEVFYNRASKINHPVYNRMAFPERLENPSRTITATCTRVSRESLVIEAPEKKGSFRRLNVRERLSVQTFPTTYVLCGKSFAEKLKMVGNAIPPAFTYLVAQAILGTKQIKAFPELEKVNSLLSFPKPVITRPDKKSQNYKTGRRFRFSIPGFNYKSGTQFELSNDASGHNWSIKFFFGNSKVIRKLDLGSANYTKFKSEWNEGEFEYATQMVENRFETLDSRILQRRWTDAESQNSLFELLVKIGNIGSSLDIQPICSDSLLKQIDSCATGSCTNVGQGPGIEKLRININSISNALVLGLIFNDRVLRDKSTLQYRREPEERAEKFALA